MSKQELSKFHFSHFGFLKISRYTMIKMASPIAMTRATSGVIREVACIENGVNERLKPHSNLKFNIISCIPI